MGFPMTPVPIQPIFFKVLTEELVKNGAVFLTPEEIAKQCDVIFLMLGYPHDVRTMTLEGHSLIDHMQPGSILIDHTTSSPSLAREIYEKMQRKENIFY